MKTSVIIASKVGAPFVDQCVQSLEGQASGPDVEVIVVVPDDAPYASRLAADYPWVRVVRAEERAVPALRRRGVEQASGAIVAVIEEHCSARGDWLAAITEALADERFTVVGGPIVDHDYPRLRDWVVYFCEYGGALPPAPDVETSDLNDANIAYRREALLDHRDLLDAGYWPMTLHGALLEQGHRFRSVPDMVVHHRGPFGFAYYLGQRFVFSRAYTGVRARQKPLPWRLTYLATGPVLPAVLLARLTAQVVAKRCRLSKFVLALPLTAVAMVVLVAGEWVGCLLGPGDALSRVE